MPQISLIATMLILNSFALAFIKAPSNHLKHVSEIEIKNILNSGSNSELKSGLAECKRTNSSEEDRAWRWLWGEFYPQYSPLETKCQFLSYEQDTDMTDENSLNEALCRVSKAQLMADAFEQSSKFDTKAIKNDFIVRQLKTILENDLSIEADDSKKESMEEVYSVAKICPYDNKNCNITTDKTWSLEDDIEGYFHESRDSDLLEYIWTAFHDVVGKDMAVQYERYVNDSLVMLNGTKFPDQGAKWRYLYDADGGDVRESASALWKEILPLYEEIFSHVRRRLSHVYPTLINPTGPIPLHLLGNMWGQTWVSLYPIVRPFNLTDSDNNVVNPIDEAMITQNYTVLKMFQTAEKFYESIGFPPLPKSFYDLSMFERPKDKNRKVVCHASAYDMYNGLDFMAKMCALVNQNDLNIVHHEMGHIYYYIAYKHQPVLLRGGGNPAFHEAIGDTMILSSTEPKYLNKIGLLKDTKRDGQAVLNHLMEEALNFVAFFPFGYLVDLWRWDTFAKVLPADEWNHHWWRLRYKYQGVTRPKPEKPDIFDPVCKYHIASKTPYIRYFFARIYIFQFHKQLCTEAGHTGPLHECTIYGSKKAGAKLWKMLQLGKSKPWPEALKVLLGDNPISAEPLKEFFKPLMKWLKTENSKFEDNCYGWGQKWPNDYKLAQPRCPEKEFPA